MLTVECRRYVSSDMRVWDNLIDTSRSPHFFFKRGFMEYHADRFRDHSLVFTVEGKEIAVMPANVKDDSLYSHQGLTYGGVLASPRMTQVMMLKLFESLVTYMKGVGLKELTYKSLPTIYFDPIAQDDLYALYRLGATLSRREPSSVLDIRKQRTTYTKGKKHSVSLANRAGLQVSRTHDWAGYMSLLESVLQERHQTMPVHTATEIELLATRFPDNIQLFIASQADHMVAGAVVFVNKSVVHTQYLATNAQGRETGALDAVVDHLLTDVFAGSKYLSFGISTEQAGHFLNEGLIQSKEAFGARTLVHDTYSLCT